MAANDNGSSGGTALPPPNIEFAVSGTPRSEMTAAAVKGVLINPLNAGVGPFPPIVGDDEWVAVCRRLLKEESPEQFLVNLLFVLRQSLSTLEA